MPGSQPTLILHLQANRPEFNTDDGEIRELISLNKLNRVCTT